MQRFARGILGNLNQKKIPLKRLVTSICHPLQTSLDRHFITTRLFDPFSIFLRNPTTKWILQKCNMLPKPLCIPSKEELENMDDEMLYLWALKLEKVPLPPNESDASPLDTGSHLSSTLGQRLLLRLIHRNHLQSKYTYATLVMTGQLKDNPYYALKLWQECSSQGHSWAKANLAQLYHQLPSSTNPSTLHSLVSYDPNRAIELYTEAWFAAPLLERQHAFTSAFNLYNLHLGLNHMEEAKSWLIQAADNAKDPLAQYQLGMAYLSGKSPLDLNQDMNKALIYLIKAADSGLSIAQHNAACIMCDYHQMDSVQPSSIGGDKEDDHTKALPCSNDEASTTSLEESNLKAFKPRLENQSGKRFPWTDHVAAAHYFSIAHAQDFYWSTLNLSIMYLRGCGVPQNITTSLALLKQVDHFGNLDQKKAVLDILDLINHHTESIQESTTDLDTIWYHPLSEEDVQDMGDIRRESFGSRATPLM